MSDIRLIVRDADREWCGIIHASFADRVIAALSADPVTLEELESATSRFIKPTPHGRMFSNFSGRASDEPYDAGLIAIDLVAKLVAVESTYSSPGLTGYVDYHDGQCCTQYSLRYHLADDWKFLSDSYKWRYFADERRQDRAARPSIDTRAVFYGRPLLEFIARECLAAFSNRKEIAVAIRAKWTEQAKARLAKERSILPEEVELDRLTDEEITPQTWPGEEEYASPFYDTLSQIHAAWLLTSRDDLNGACPREIAIGQRDHIVWDMQDRCEQWSILKQCAPGLTESSHAFRLSGFGTHEIVKYYDLVRELLWSCWEQLEGLANSPQAGSRPDALTAGDFLTVEVPRLETVRDVWLDTPDPDCYGRTPRSIINRERRRIPETVSGHEAMIDPDCPCCQMMADSPGPMFWHLDGCNNDDDFAFDMWHKTRQEWEDDRRKWEENSRRFSEELEERKQLKVTDSRNDGAENLWSRRCSIGNVEVPLGVRIFGLGCRLAELIVGLRAGSPREATSPEAQLHIDQLNRDFGNLRNILENSDASLAAALVDPVLQRFAEDLEVIATNRPDLGEQCLSLVNDLGQLLEPPAEQEPPEDGDDSELPF